VADGIDAAMEAMQPAELESSRDRPSIESERNELPPAYDAMLALGEIGELAVWGCSCTHTVH